MDIVNSTLERIKPVSRELLEQAQTRLDNKTKPPGSLGRLEEFAGSEDNVHPGPQQIRQHESDGVDRHGGRNG